MAIGMMARCRPPTAGGSETVGLGEGHEKEHAEQHRVAERYPGCRATESRAAEEPGIDQGGAKGAFASGEERQERGSDAKSADRHQRGEAGCGDVIEDCDDEHQCGAKDERASPIERTVWLRAGSSGKSQPADHDGDGADGDGEPEDPPPVERGQDEAAQRWARAHAHGLRRREPAESPAALVLGNRLHQDGNTVRAEKGAADPLQKAEDDELLEAGCEAAKGAGEAEDEIAANVQRLAAEHLAQNAEDRQEGDEGGEVGQGYPADLIQRCVEIVPQCWQGELDDRGVQLTNERPERDQTNNEPGMPGLAFEPRYGRRL